ncbi:glycosyltransferase family 2 protein [Aestuariivivens sediminicola]|uniref:glycosyltransferase family 2 protein n=1 Tax=Aestuariivivens sediminicola TaxID=2913560 RepID=UPI001F588EA2|nr:glycosyltransferase family 2 protein [Aestuariivivens sediminicola]
MVDKKPLVTIILPVYNGESTLKTTLESLLNQTYTNFELLIGIDGSKDRSKAIAESFKDPRITVTENPVNLGLGPNTNKLIASASPESAFIAMAEQDDVYVSERIEWQVAVMQQYPKVGLVSGIAEFVSDHRRVLFPGLLVNGKQFPQGEALFKFLYINQLKVVNTCMMLRKSVHTGNHLTFTNRYPNMNVDWDYVLRFALVSQVYGIPRKLVAINRKVANQSVTTNKALQHKTTRKLLKDFRDEFPNIVTRQDYKKALKMHRKIELGHHSKFGIIAYSIYYYLLYFDGYFLNYIQLKIKNWIKTL